MFLALVFACLLPINFLTLAEAAAFALGCLSLKTGYVGSLLSPFDRRYKSHILVKWLMYIPGDLYMRALNIGLSEEQRQGVVDMLNKDLADSYLLIIKTKKYHWDVVGPQFRTLHELWEEHYTAISLNIDAIAERIRALGGYPVGTAQGFLRQCNPT